MEVHGLGGFAHEAVQQNHGAFGLFEDLEEGSAEVSDDTVKDSEDTDDTRWSTTALPSPFGQGFVVTLGRIDAQARTREASRRWGRLPNRC